MLNRSRNYWRNLALFTLLVTIVSTAAGALWLSCTRALNLVHPARHLASRTPSDVGLNHWQNVMFKSADGLQLEGWFIMPKSRFPYATMIFVHGLGASRDELLDEAAMLVAHGYAALLFDLRNHGASDGTLTTLGYAEVDDVLGAVQYVLTRTDVDAQRLGLVGHSMGGGTVLRAMPKIPQVRVVIAESAYTSIEDNIADGVRGLAGLPPFPFAPLVIWFGERAANVDIHQVRPIDDVPQIAPRAIMFIHGEQDQLVPVRNSLQLYQAAHEPKLLYVIPNADHNELLAANPSEFERQVIGFLARCDVLAKCN